MNTPEAPRIVLSLADLRRLTILERARACATAGIAEQDLAGLLRAVAGHHGTPEELERGVLILYAIAWQLGRRSDPGLSWDTAQGWDLALDMTPEAVDPVAEAEAAASIDAALATGLPPSIAGELSLAQLERYGTRRREAARTTRRHVRQR